MHPVLKSLAAVTSVAALVPLAACGSSNDSGAQSGGQTLTVFAAASLETTFDTLGKQFEAAHPGVTVKFDYDGSSTLVSQIQQGAPADVFASADEPNMSKLGSTAQSPKDFATNVLEIATPPGNPAHISSLADLGKPGVKVVVCAAGVPCGDAATQLEKDQGVTVSPVSEEQSVTDVLGKVESGEADAGLVYVTDVKGAGSKVTGVPIKGTAQVTNTYPIATLQGASQPQLASEFVDYVLGSQGQQALQAAGFGAPKA